MLSVLLFLSRRQLRRSVYCLDTSNASDSSISQLTEKTSYILNLPYRLFLCNQQFRQKKPQSRRTAAHLSLILELFDNGSNTA